MKCKRSATTAFVAVLAAMLVVASSARAQVLQQVPSDAVVVIKVNGMKSVSDKVAKFGTQLGIAAFVPQFADPLGSVQQSIGISEGLDPAGEMAMVLTKKAFDGTAGADPGLLVYMPVTDYKAFLGNFRDVEAAGGVSTFKPKDREDEMYAANWGKYAVITRTQGILEQKPTGLKLAGLAAKEAKEKDVFVFANIPILAEFAKPHIAEARTEAMKEMNDAINSDDAAKEFAGLGKVLVDLVFNVAEGYLRDATAAGMGLQIGEDGISATMMTEFKPNTYAANLAKGMKSSNQPMMAGLPDRKYFAVGGFTNSPEVTSKIMADVLDPIGKELAAMENGKSFAPTIDAIKKMMTASKSVAFGYAMPNGEPGAEALMQTVSVVRGDSKVIAESQKQVMTSMTDLFGAMTKQEGAPQMKFEVTPGGKTVGDVKLDTYVVDMNLPEGSPEAAQFQQTMGMFYGPNGMSGVFGPVGKDAFVAVQGGTDELLSETVSAAKNPKDAIGGTDGVKKVSAKLPSNRIGVEYVFVDNIISTGLKFAASQGMPIQLQVPENLSPIGMSFATEGTAFRADAFIPTDLVQAIVGVGMQVGMQMGGGGGPAPEPGGNPDGL